MDLSTTYLGKTLKNPLVPSASPLSRELDSAKKLEDAGASALVVYSLFEEEILAEEEELERLWELQGLGHGEADTYLPMNFDCITRLENYISHIDKLSSALDIPIIGSLNCVTEGGWITHAQEIEAAGADALELNIYHIPADINENATKIEEKYISIVRQLSQQVNIPLAVKLSSQFTAPVHFVNQLEQAGADGVVLFNRFYQPDLNLETMQLDHQLHLSNKYEALLRMHWIALMHGRISLSLAATGGVHTSNEVLKLLLVGADVTQLAAALLKQGAGHLMTILNEMTAWMENNEYESVEQLKGSYSQLKSPEPWMFERANYLEMLGKNYRIALD